jgi:diaminohydroxyphosphoribosylaminopyrimidine deaminase / 5-amino-6-(5-phosphoribosylamino)uracil reductase
MSFSAIDFEMMSLALREAKKGLYTTDPNPRVGSVLVKNNRIVGTGWHQQAGGPHAEIRALANAGQDAKGADCYVTLEPCSHHGKTGPCAEALIKAGVKRVIVACTDPNPCVSGRGIDLLQAADIETVTGCLKDEAEALNAGFLKRMRSGYPLVRVKMAVSLDGRTALANGRSQWITGPQARMDVHRLRARSSAVVTGNGTLLADDPWLTVRSEEVLAQSHGFPRQPLRVVLDGRGLSEPGNLLFAVPDSFERAPSLIVTLPESYANLQQKEFSAQTQLIAAPADQVGHIDLHAVLATLANLECNELLVEAGPTLAGAFFREQLVDELWLYQATKLLGSEGRAAFTLPGFTALIDVPELKLVDLRQIGADVRMILRMSE